MDTHGSGEDCQENKQPLGPTNYGQRCGNLCLMHQNVKRSKSGLLRNQSSKMPGYFVVFISFILKTRNPSFTMESARRKLEIPLPAAMHCKTSLCRSSRETCSTIGEHKTRDACIVEADESVRVRMERAPGRYHEDYIAEKGMNSPSQYNLVHKFIPMRQAMKIPDAKGSGRQIMGKFEKRLAWNLAKVKNKREVIAEAKNKGTTVHSASLMDLCHLKGSELEP